MYKLLLPICCIAFITHSLTLDASNEKKNWLGPPCSTLNFNCNPSPIAQDPMIGTCTANASCVDLTQYNELVNPNAYPGGPVSVYWYNGTPCPSGVDIEDITGNLTCVNLNSFPNLWVLVVENGSCAAQIPVTVTINPTGPLLNVSANGFPVNASECEGEDVNFDANPSQGAGQPPYSFQWMGPNGPFSNLQNPLLEDVKLSDAGTYHVTATDAFGCTGEGQLNLTIYSNPSCFINGPLVVCSGQQGIIYTAPAGMTIYNWNIEMGDASIVGDDDKQEVVINVGTSPFTLKLETGIAPGGFFCISTCEEMIEIGDGPICNISGPEQVCIGTPEVTFSTPSDSTFTYEWSIISGDATLVDSTSTLPDVIVHPDSMDFEVQLMVIDGNGCSNICSYEVETLFSPTGSITVSSPRICANDTLYLTFNTDDGIGPYTIKTNGQTFDSIASGSIFDTIVADDFFMDTTVFYLTSIIDRGINPNCFSVLNDTLSTDTVLLIDLPKVEISESPESCEGDTTLSISVNILEGSPHQYFVYFDSTSLAAGFINFSRFLSGDTVLFDIPNQIEEGSYHGCIVFLDTLNSCASSDSLEISIMVKRQPILNVDVGNTIDPSFCGGNNGQLSFFTNLPNGTYFLNYDNGNFSNVSVEDGVVIVPNLFADDYQNITVNLQNCISTPISYSLNDPTQVTYSISTKSTSTCGNQDGELIFDGLEPSQGGYFISYSYNGQTISLTNQISSANGQIVITDLFSGIYSDISVEINGCLGETPLVTIGDPPLPPIAQPNFSEVEFCEGSTVPFITVNDPGPGFEVLWFNELSGGNIVENPILQGIRNNSILLTPSSTPKAPLPGQSVTIYAQIINTITQCLSPVRKPIKLTNYELPPDAIVPNVSFCENESSKPIIAESPIGSGQTIRWYLDSIGNQTVNASIIGNFGEILILDQNSTPPLPNTGDSVTVYATILVGSSSCESKNRTPVTLSIFETPEVNITFDDTSGIINDGVVCEGNTINLNVEVQGGNNNYTYVWNNISSSGSMAIVTPSFPATNYEVTVTDGNMCSGIANQTINVNPFPEIDIVATTANMPPDVGDDIDFSANILNGGNIVVWDWKFGTNANIPTGNTPTVQNVSYNISAPVTVTLNVTDIFGCQSFDSEDINIAPGACLADFNIENGTNICESSPFAFEDNSVTSTDKMLTQRQWNFGPNANPSTSTLQNPLVSFEGINDPISDYPVILTVQDNSGCINSDTVFVNLFPKPNVQMPSFDPICQNEPVLNLTTGTPSTSSSGTGIYLINDVQSTFFDPKLIGVGTYTIRYIYTTSSALGMCSDFEERVIEVLDTPIVNLNLDLDILCQNDNIITLSGGILDPMADDSFFSGNGVNNVGEFNPTQVFPGDQVITLTAQKGICKGMDSDIIKVNAPPQAIIENLSGSAVAVGTPIILDNASVAGSDDNLFYTWTINGGAPMVQLNIDTIFQSPTTLEFCLNAIDNNGCSSSVCEVIQVITPNNCSANIEIIGDQTAICRGDTVYFDPSNSNANPGAIIVNYNWTILNTLGVPIQTQNNSDGNVFQFPFDVAPGAYTVSLFIQDQVSCERVVSQTIDVETIPNVSFQAPDFCENNGDEVLIGGASDLPGLGFYSGQNVSFNGSFDTNVPPGKYEVTYTFTDNQGLIGCSSSATDSVEVLARPIILDIETNPSLAFLGLPIQFSAVTNPLSGLNYNWSFGLQGTPTSSTNETPEVIYPSSSTTSQNISLTVTDIFGCESSFNKDINLILSDACEAIISINGEQILEAATFEFCQNDELNLDAVLSVPTPSQSPGFVSFEWLFDTIGVLSSDSNPQMNFPNSGILSLYVTDNVGCVDSVSINLISNELPSFEILSVDNDNVVCVNQTARYGILIDNALSEVSYEWEVYDENNNLLESTLTDNPFLNVTWKKSSAPGAFNIYVKIANEETGCIGFDELDVVVSSSILATKQTYDIIQIERDEEVALVYPQKGLCYQWHASPFDSFNNPSDNSVHLIEGATLQYLTLLQADSLGGFQPDKIAYWVEVWDKNGDECITNEDCKTPIFYQDYHKQINIEGLILPKGAPGLQLKLLPNPNNGSFQVKLVGDSTGYYNWQVIDYMGRFIKEGNIQKESPFDHTENIILNFLSNGVYVLILTDQHGERLVKRFVVQSK